MGVPVDMFRLADELGYFSVREMLTKLYQKMTIEQIAVKLGVSAWTVNEWMKRLDIPRRCKGVSPEAT